MFAFISVALIFCLVTYIAYLPSCACEKKFLKKNNQNPSPNVRSRIQEVFLVPSYMLRTFVIGSIFICLVLKQHGDLRNYLMYFALIPSLGT